MRGEHPIEPLAGVGCADGQLLNGGVVFTHDTAIMTPQSDEEPPLDPAQARIVARVRWLMLISGFATVIGIAVIIGVIGYRFFKIDGSVVHPEVTARLPRGAVVLSTGVSGGRLA